MHEQDLFKLFQDFYVFTFLSAYHHSMSIQCDLCIKYRKQFKIVLN